MVDRIVTALEQSVHEELVRLQTGDEVDGGRMRADLEPVFAAAGYRTASDDDMVVPSILVLLIDAISDTVLTSGLLRELRRSHPRSYIAVLVRPALVPLVAECPYINELIPLAGERETSDLLAMEPVLRERIWPRHFALALSRIWGPDYRDYRRCLLYLSGARERVDFGDRVFDVYGYPSEPSATESLLTQAVLTPASYTHEAARIYYMLEAMGCPPQDKSMELWYGTADAVQAGRWLHDLPAGSLRIVVGIGAGAATRKYPIPQLSSGLRDIARRYDVACIIVGGAAEQAEAQQLASLLPGINMLNLCGRLSLTETEAVIAQTDMYIGNDTGVMHMAAAAKKPVIELSRDPIDKDGVLSPIFSSVCRFAPWQTPYVALRPEHAIGSCREVLVYGGCVSSVAHCIATIPPEAIAAAFAALAGQCFASGDDCYSKTVRQIYVAQHAR